MTTFLMAIHILACVLLILLVLLQAGRGAGFAIFGGGGDTLFASPSGSSFLRQATVVLAGTFAATSLMLTLLGSRVGMKSVTKDAVNVPAAPSAPSVPGKIPPRPEKKSEAPSPAPASGQ